MVLECLALGLNEAGSLTALIENLVLEIASVLVSLAAQVSCWASFVVTESHSKYPMLHLKLVV